MYMNLKVKLNLIFFFIHNVFQNNEKLPELTAPQLSFKIT